MIGTIKEAEWKESISKKEPYLRLKLEVDGITRYTVTSPVAFEWFKMFCQFTKWNYDSPLAELNEKIVSVELDWQRYQDKLHYRCSLDFPQMNKANVGNQMTNEPNEMTLEDVIADLEDICEDLNDTMKYIKEEYKGVRSISIAHTIIIGRNSLLTAIKSLKEDNDIR